MRVGEDVETGEDSSDTVAVGDTKIGPQGIQQRIATQEQAHLWEQTQKKRKQGLEDLLRTKSNSSLVPKG